MVQMMGKYFIDNKSNGCIVNMASQIALDKQAAYCGSKGVFIAITKVMAMEWGQYGIRVNVASPTVIPTEFGHKTRDGPVGEYTIK